MSRHIPILSRQADHCRTSVSISSAPNPSFPGCAVLSISSGAAYLQTYPTSAELRTLALAASSLALRKRRPLLALGVFWFLAAQAMTAMMPPLAFIEKSVASINA